MPGLNQLKQFNSDLLNLGDEVKIRSARGEKPSLIPIPKDVKDIDDSEDFKNGMPQLSEEEQAQADAAAAEAAREQNDFSDITGIGSDDDGDEEVVAAPVVPDMSDLLAPSDGLSLDDLDLSEFEEPAAPKEPPKPKEIPIEDLDLDALLAPKPKAPEPAQKPAPKPAARPAPKPVAPEPDFSDSVSTQDLFSTSDLDTPLDLDTSGLDSDLASLDSFELPSEGLDSDLSSDSDSLDSADTLDSLDSFDSFDAAPSASDDFASGDTEQAPETEETEAFDIDAENKEFAKAAVAGESLIDMNLDIPEEFNEVPGVLDEGNLMESFEAEANGTAGDEPGESVPDISESVEVSLEEPSMDSFNLDGLTDLDTSSFDAPAAEVAEDVSEEVAAEEDASIPAQDGLDGLDLPDMDSMDFNTDGLDGMESMDFGDTSDFGATSDSAAETDFGAASDTDSVPASDSIDGFSMDDLPDFGADDSASVSPEMEVPDSDFDMGGEGTEDTFDTSAISGLDFSNNSMSGEGTDFELGNITGQETDEDDLFSIPGFSDTQTADLNRNKPDVQIPDFSDALEGGNKPKNTFTDAEYKRFQKNLGDYPLNVRIAIEDLVVKNEFTDDAVFAVLEKVLRKAPARQIATELEKMLDVTLDVPRDFERRSAEEYELYKKSLEYQLRNRIIPGAIISAGAAILITCLFLISWTFIYKPSMANRLYRQGYVLLQENQYPQSLDRFNKALTYKTQKEWFYKYAQAFRKHKQYERSSSMYKAILAAFNHEKQAGMEWADMEMNDLYNYEETERILKREVLDYHINDPDAILMLGDLYLDWATESDPSKFALAKEKYDLVAQVGRASDTNKYLSRQMRYFIRTDNLREVLAYKDYFFPIKKNGLDSKDLTELSGFMLDKMYGNLRPAEEVLRFSIENVRELLERAIKADPENPVALYNMGRYFIETNNNSALPLLQESIKKFEAQTKRNRSETYKYINAYRLLGEQYRDKREYILAEERYGDGIAIYEKEHADSGFVSDENVGKLYEDIADLDYFISGDMDRALTNYQNSVSNKNDTASIRYKIGYIQYTKQDYGKAIGSFIRSSDMAPNDTHLLLALANTLSLRNDDQAAEGYYNNLISQLNSSRELHGVLFPQVRADQADLVDCYMRATNNLGVTLARRADLTGNSALNAKALVNFQNSLRAYDALTRNQETMVRLEGSNLAEQNVKYLTNPTSDYRPEIYADIFKLMNGEEGLE